MNTVQLKFGGTMRRRQRPRRYVSSHLLVLLLPLFRYSLTRDAYVLRLVGQRFGPVLRAERRRRSRSAYSGPERRAAA
ncbi:MAG: hypothetical protein ABSC56_01385 [Solirubrobacteraceae bacterium]|jgi:hypothetical protein